MTEIRDTIKDIAASLYMKPCTINELMQRDFIKGRSEYGVQTFLNIGRQKGWIFERNEIWYTYKKFALSNEMREYELKS